MVVLDDMGVFDNIIVIYLIDNGFEYSVWLYGGIIFFCGEKMIIYEGGVCVFMIVCWLGKVFVNMILMGI